MGQGTGGGGGRGGGVAKGAQLGRLVVAGVSLRANIHLGQILEPCVFFRRIECLPTSAGNSYIPCRK